MYIFVDKPKDSLTRIALSRDDESDYETTKCNMKHLDRDYICTTSSDVLTTKYYLENDFNDLIKNNDSYAKGFSLIHLIFKVYRRI